MFKRIIDTNIFIILFFLLLACNNKNETTQKKAFLSYDAIKLEKNNLLNKVIDDSIVVYLNDIKIVEDKLVVSDQVSDQVRMIDFEGNLINSFGGSGHGPNEFVVSPGFISYNKITKKYAIIDLTTAKVKIINEKFKYETEFYGPVPIFNLTFSDTNLFCSYLASEGLFHEIQVFDSEYKKYFSFDPKGLHENFMFNPTYLRYNSKNQTIIVAFMFKNSIQIFDKDGKYLNEYSIKYFPSISSSEDISKLNLRFSNVPKEKIIVDVELSDKGDLYVLCGEFAKNPYRDIILLDINGKIKEIYTIAEKAQNIEIYKNNIVCVVNEETEIVSYSLPKLIN